MAHKYTKRGHYVNIYGDAKIGENTRIGSFCDIGGVIGNHCKIQSFNFIPPGVIIQDDVFVGPGCVFTNHKHPKVDDPIFVPEVTLVKRGANIGARCTILPGVIIGEGAMIGAGSVVTKDVPAGETWFGHPATKYEKET